MADGRHSGKIEKSHISGTIGPIATKFGMMMQFEPLEHSVKISKI